ncbi:hypothetical protein ACFLIM_31900 [Nonomuraea sp. M3C6]|uniref:Uncharacterized protein n=1 Tax=Nonomuraea marmarensis TaxID=3351344 RepID=A0ABW7ANI3_9ACTN
METSAAVEVPICLARTRTKLCVFVVLTVVSAVHGGSAWATLALALTCVAIPLAVAALGGIHLVRDLLFGPADQEH